ncbi:helix-turn-helix transcriptional regulator, partial [Escherichia coli]|uniref:helix-turn-helix transcriptional regulator n=1 Tax=Escherichia coli TaxID=562 RepID=UPI00201B1A7A
FGFAENTDDLFVGKTLLHGDVLMWLMKTLLTSGCTNQRGAGHPELIYCWEQLKTSISRGFSTQIQEHLAMGVLLSLGAHHVNCLLLSDSKQSLISRCYNLMLSEPGTKWTANKVARYLYISVSTLHRRLASEGVSFQSILDDVRLNNALSAIQTTVKPISEIARENGYKCPSRFTERFHNRFKITPRELRKASRE